MEHEVNVPFPVKAVRAALADTARVARCVPGLQPDDDQRPADAEGTVAGRLRVKAGGSTITYRGSLTVTSTGDELTVTGTGTEARGSGSVRLDLTVVPKPATEGEGTRLVCSGTVEGDGRLADIEAKTARSAGVRLLDRFGRALSESMDSSGEDAADEAGADAGSGADSSGDSGSGAAADQGGGPATATPTTTSAAAGGIGEPGDNDRVIPGIPGPGDHDAREADSTASERGSASAEEEATETAETGKTAETGATGESAASDADGANDEPGSAEQPGSADETADETVEDTSGQSSDETPGEPGGVFDAPVPPSSLDPVYDDEDQLSDEELNAAAEAEAAHARRTMIGRSAEEVDHAPPRGRYAPVPAPQTVATPAPMRWAAPAAALAVASAVVAFRALRRRR
jgi:carbon monoxide dehydrogenase subunit G